MSVKRIPYCGDCGEDHKKVKQRRLRPGDTVGIVSSSMSVLTDGDVDTLEKQIIDLFAEFKLKVKFAKHWASDSDPLYAGTPEERREDLMNMFLDPEVDVIMASKGGGGAIDVVPLLDYDVIKKHPKLYIGFSDPTFIHAALQSRADLITMYSPNALMDWTDSMKQWFSCILMQNRLITFKNPGTKTISKGKAVGKLIGGLFELILVTPLTGYEYNLDEPYILFLESISRSNSILGSRLEAMDQYGLFKNAVGLVFGECPRCPGEDLNINEQVRKIWRKYPHIPSYTGAKITHDDGSFTLPMNILYEIDATKGELKMLESPVRK